MLLRTRNQLIWLVAAALSAAALATASPAAFAQDQAPEQTSDKVSEKDLEQAQTQPRRPAPTSGEKAGKTMTKAYDLLSKDDYAGARAMLNGIAREGLSPFDLSRLEQIWCQIEISQNNYPAARQHMQKSIDSGGLSKSEILNAKFQIAQLYIAEENYTQGMAMLKEWFKATPTPGPSAYYTLAGAYYQMGDINAAFEPAKKAVEMSDKPQASWIELLLGIYLTRENYDAALPLLERLIVMQPHKKNHWLTLSSIYHQREDFAKALAAIQIADNAGYLKEPSDYERLVGMLRFNNIPYRAARVLEQSLENKTLEADSKNYEKLADSWIQARDYDAAIPPLTRAAELSKNGEQFVRLGEVQIQLKQWSQAVDALQQGLKKGGLKDTGKANLLAGIALFNQDRLNDAVKYFQRATSSEKHGETASDYITLIRIKQQP